MVTNQIPETNQEGKHKAWALSFRSSPYSSRWWRKRLKSLFSRTGQGVLNSYKQTCAALGQGPPDVQRSPGPLSSGMMHSSNLPVPPWVMNLPLPEGAEWCYAIYRLLENQLYHLRREHRFTIMGPSYETKKAQSVLSKLTLNKKDSL